jgi:hypothetical protein
MVYDKSDVITTLKWSGFTSKQGFTILSIETVTSKLGQGKSMAVTLADQGVRVNTVSPGAVLIF